MGVWFPGDIEALAKQVLADAVGVDATVSSCTNLSAAEKASWAAFYANVKDFAAKTSSWTFGWTGSSADDAQLLQRKLYAWEQKLSANCKLTVPIVNPDPEPPPNPITTALKYGAIISGFLGSAYIVGKALEWLPKPLAREKRLPAGR